MQTSHIHVALRRPFERCPETLKEAHSASVRNSIRAYNQWLPGHMA